MHICIYVFIFVFIDYENCLVCVKSMILCICIYGCEYVYMHACIYVCTYVYVFQDFFSTVSESFAAIVCRLSSPSCNSMTQSGCDFKTTDDGDDKNLGKPMKHQKTKSSDVEVKPEQVCGQELAQLSVLQSYYVTDFSPPPLFAELTEDEKAQVMQAKEEDRVYECFLGNCKILAKAGFSLSEKRCSFDDVNVFDLRHSLSIQTKLQVQDVALFIFNSPNHGTCGKKAQSQNTGSSNAFTQQAFEAMRNFGDASALMVFPMQYEPWCPCKKDGRVVMMAPAECNGYTPCKSKRTVVERMSVTEGCMAMCALVPEHLQFAKKNMSEKGELRVLDLVIDILVHENINKKRSVVSLGAYIADFECAVLTAFQRHESTLEIK